MRITVMLLITSFILAGCSEEQTFQEKDNRIKAKPEDVAEIRKILAAELESQMKTDGSDSDVVSSLAKEAEAIYTAFWNPKNLKQYGKHEWDSELYADADYLITQPDLLVARRKGREWSFANGYFGQHYNYRHEPDASEWQILRIQDFSPDLKIPQARVLHLTPSLSKSLHDFLEADFTEAGTPDIMSPANAKGVSRLKLAAVREVIMIFPKHWGDGWHLASHPEVEQILINEDLTRAVVAFRIAYQGGFTCMERNDEGWRITDSQVRWIQ